MGCAKPPFPFLVKVTTAGPSLPHPWLFRLFGLCFTSGSSTTPTFLPREIGFIFFSIGLLAPSPAFWSCVMHRVEQRATCHCIVPLRLPCTALSSPQRGLIKLPAHSFRC